LGFTCLYTQSTCTVRRALCVHLVHSPQHWDSPVCTLRVCTVRRALCVHLGHSPQHWDSSVCTPSRPPHIILVTVHTSPKILFHLQAPSNRGRHVATQWYTFHQSWNNDGLSPSCQVSEKSPYILNTDLC
ncbi:hypothetical protein NDU88_000347, partial [Pleurodeles waltl]